MENTLKVIPLGGVEEIGLNMTVFHYGTDMFIVDCGLMFPEDDMPGVDFLLPDYSYILNNKQDLKGIIITHGHEDHTGALPFLLRDIAIDVTIYATLLTLGLIREKLKEYNITNAALQTIKPREKITLGVFEIEFIRVTHSIVDGVGLAILTPLGNIIHTGDFKLDPTPVDGQLMDFNRFSFYGENGVMLLLSDSTNAEKGGYTFSEKEVRRSFEIIFSKAKNRIIIATFASNIHRIQQAIDVAVQFNKKVILCGRSIVLNAQIAIDLGYLTVPEDTLVKLEKLNSIPPDKVVIITTGSQGEPMSVLTRIAIGEHKQINIVKDDIVIVSAKMIPGNERAIGKIINHLCKRGADVIYEKVSEVHVSGHASKEELKLMLNIIKPKYFIPIHGEYRHHASHAKLARNLNVKDDHIFIMHNGEILEITDEGAAINGKTISGRIFVDGKGLGDVKDIVLRDRRHLSQDGIVIVHIIMDKEHGTILSGPEIISRGFLVINNEEDILEKAREILEEQLRALNQEITEDNTILQAKIVSILKKYFRNTINRRPMIMPIVMEM
ncbi:MAG: ribonuclease J [Nitrospirae bacterium]|nr:ribonuclease J [Nitrospirota bacterium]MBF0541782.1 ribonuclease J [Nitrospirota bacterium]